MTLTEEQKALFDALTQLQKKFVTHILTGANGGPIQTSNLSPDEAAEAYRKMMG